MEPWLPDGWVFFWAWCLQQSRFESQRFHRALDQGLVSGLSLPGRVDVVLPVIVAAGRIGTALDWSAKILLLFTDWRQLVGLLVIRTGVLFVTSAIMPDRSAVWIAGTLLIVPSGIALLIAIGV